MPAIPIEQDCTDYAQLNSQISDLFLRWNGAPDVFASWQTIPTYVAGAVDNANTDNSKSKWLVGIGGIGVPEKQTLLYPKRKKRQGARTYSLTFRVLNLNDAMFEFLRKLQCGTTNFTFYFADIENYIYGKEGGLIPESIDVDFPRGEGNDDKLVAVLTLTFVADGDPQRRVNPYV
jgi:hypothetical protein